MLLHGNCLDVLPRIGIEMNQDYLKLARQRLRRAKQAS